MTATAWPAKPRRRRRPIRVHRGAAEGDLVQRDRREREAEPDGQHLSAEQTELEGRPGLEPRGRFDVTLAWSRKATLASWPVISAAQPRIISAIAILTGSRSAGSSPQRHDEVVRRDADDQDGRSYGEAGRPGEHVGRTSGDPRARAG
jgi:hypothetical protein